MGRDCNDPGGILEDLVIAPFAQSRKKWLFADTFIANQLIHFNDIWDASFFCDMAGAVEKKSVPFID
jgi:hypothetical protein